MDHAVALVDACLQINGYFTVAVYPVIKSFGKQHTLLHTELDLGPAAAQTHGRHFRFKNKVHPHRARELK